MLGPAHAPKKEAVGMVWPNVEGDLLGCSRAGISCGCGHRSALREFDREGEARLAAGRRNSDPKVLVAGRLGTLKDVRALHNGSARIPMPPSHEFAVYAPRAVSERSGARTGSTVTLPHRALSNLASFEPYPRSKPFTASHNVGSRLRRP